MVSNYDKKEFQKIQSRNDYLLKRLESLDDSKFKPQKIMMKQKVSIDSSSILKSISTPTREQ